MSIQDIFQELVLNKNEESLYNLIQEIKNSIPEKQKIGKVIVWSLRQVRKQIQEKLSLDLQRQSLKVLINSKYWQIRMMVALLASSSASKEGSVSDYISYIENTANDSHFAVRESAQMALRELLQDFPNDIILIYNEWVKNSNEFTRRCVSESLRPVLVNRRNWIKEKPKEAMKILKNLNCDPSLYVRKSVANNLSDISRKYPDLVLLTLGEWLSENDYDKRTFFIARKACRNIVKTKPEAVNKLLKGLSIIR